MAILTAAELKASREAIEAGVDDVSDPAAVSAIALAEATMNKALGYKVANSATSLTLGSSSADYLSLPERVRTISGITDSTYGGNAQTVSDYYEIRGDGFSVWRRGRWLDNGTVVITGTFGFASTDDEYILAKQFVLLYAVRYLQRTSTDDEFPTPSGALLTGFASEQANFTFFTPTGDTTGYQDLDILLEQIGRHPNKKPGLYTVSITRGERELTFDDIIGGREGVEDL
jgi:hypothetical protein